ncbi:unnamed protein product, partial [Prunus brigantina]
GEVLQYSRLPKRSRATEESEDASELLIDSHVDLVKNVGINIDCLDDVYDDLNDEEDVIISRDLTKPLEAFVQINQTWYNIEYEGLPDICYLCGRYGHKRDSCEIKAPGHADSVGEGHIPNE